MFRCDTLCGQALCGHMTSVTEMQLPCFVMDVQVYYSVWAGIVRSCDKHDKGAVTIHCDGCSSVLLSSGRCYEVT